MGSAMVGTYQSWDGFIAHHTYKGLLARQQRFEPYILVPVPREPFGVLPDNCWLIPGWLLERSVPLVVHILTIGKLFIIQEWQPCINSMEHVYNCWVKPLHRNMANRLFLLWRGFSGLIILIISFPAAHGISLDFPDYWQRFTHRVMWISAVNVFTYFNLFIKFLWCELATGGHKQWQVEITIILLPLPRVLALACFSLSTMLLELKGRVLAGEGDTVEEAILTLVFLSDWWIWEQRYFNEIHSSSTLDILPAVISSCRLDKAFSDKRVIHTWFQGFVRGLNQAMMIHSLEGRQDWSLTKLSTSCCVAQAGEVSGILVPESQAFSAVKNFLMCA